MRRSKRRTSGKGGLSFLAREGLFSPADGGKRSLTSFQRSTADTYWNRLGCRPTCRRRPANCSDACTPWPTRDCYWSPSIQPGGGCFQKRQDGSCRHLGESWPYKSFSVGRGEAGDKSSDAARAHRYTRQTGLSEVWIWIRLVCSRRQQVASTGDRETSAMAFPFDQRFPHA
jgi:hypothetical protein